MTSELDILRRIDAGLEAHALPYMLTGSFALARYTTPRMTRDIDIVVALKSEDVDKVANEFAADFYVDVDAAHAAVRSERLFNMMHQASALKVDFIVRKSSEYRRVEFDRRQRATLGNVDAWIVSREDLILSKLLWSRDTHSELQRRDARQLLDSVDLDRAYLSSWAARLGVDTLLSQLWT
jgi:hypothetical protein